MPTFNREETIGRAIDSVIEQTYQDWELIVVDDGSNDDTKQVVLNYADERIIYLRNDKNLGSNPSRNIGIRRASGECVAFLDSDNTWKKEKLEVQVSKLNSGYDMIFCALLCHEGGVVSRIPSVGGINEENLKSILKDRNIVDTSTIMIKHDFLLSIGAFDEEMPRLQDYDLAIRAVNYGRVGYIEQELVDMYRMEVSITNNKPILLAAIRRLLKKYPSFFFGDYGIYNQLKKGYDYCVQNTIKGKDVLEYVNSVCAELGTQFPEDIQKFREYIILKAIEIQEEKRAVINLLDKNIHGQLKYVDEFVIYGAGNMARRFYYQLEESIRRKVKYFLVTERKDLDREIDNKEVIGISEERTQNEKRDVLILIAVSKEYYHSIKDSLNKAGFFNFVYWMR